MKDTLTVRIDDAVRRLHAIADALPLVLEAFDNAAEAEQEMKVIEANLTALTYALTGGDPDIEFEFGISHPELV